MYRFERTFTCSIDRALWRICQMNGSQWSRRHHFGRSDRRAEPRDACAGVAIVDILAPHPRPAVSAKVVDVGGGGLKLVLPFFVTLGSIVRMHLTKAVAQAETKYCTCGAGEY